MSALDEVLRQIGDQYLPRGMRIHNCPIHGAFLAHYTQENPTCPECGYIQAEDTSPNPSGNAVDTNTLEYEIDLNQDAMRAERMKDAIENLLGITRSVSDTDLNKARSKSEWKEVTKRKESKYGDDEVFADPQHNSYPLTKNGKPSRERVLAAWRYINQRRNAGEYSSAKVARIKAKIKRFAKEHFDMDLQDE